MVFASSRRLVKRKERRVETFQDWEGLKMLRTGGDDSRFGGLFLLGVQDPIACNAELFQSLWKKTTGGTNDLN